MIQALRRRLFSTDAAERAVALELLAAACPGASELTGDLEPLLRKSPLSPVELGSGAELDPSAEAATLDALLRSADPYLRAAALWAAAPFRGVEPLRAALDRARHDDHPLVRETAAWFAADDVAPARLDGARPLSTVETMHLLHAVPLFTGLDPEDLHELALYAFEETISPPRAVFEQGDADSDALFVILAGRVVVHRSRVEVAATDGGPAGDAPFAAAPRIERLGPGAVLGELSVLDGSRRDVTALPADGPVRVLRIPGASFRGGLLRRTRVTEWLLAALAGRIRRMGEAERRR
jgi:CRP-like cAMP-binding protein